MSTILAAEGLTKRFRDPRTWRRVTVLDSLDLALEEGEIFGLIGHNGAGKTTTFKLLLGFLRPTRGRVTIDGKPLGTAARASIGFLPEQPYFYDHLTVEETLEFYGQLYGMSGSARAERIRSLLAQLHLESKRHASLRTLSKGTLQRLGVAQAILNRPRLVILDEPMSGLDPAGRRHMRELIAGLRGEGTTVLFSSHILPDAEALCSRVGILARGRLEEVVAVREGDPSAYLMAVRRLTAAAVATLARIAGEPPAPSGDQWTVRLRDSDAVRAALDAVRSADGIVESLIPVRASLEERFLAQVQPAQTLD